MCIDKRVVRVPSGLDFYADRASRWTGLDRERGLRSHVSGTKNAVIHFQRV